MHIRYIDCHICANICGKVSSSAKYKTLTTLAQWMCKEHVTCVPPYSFR